MKVLRADTNAEKLGHKGGVPYVYIYIYCVFSQRPQLSSVLFFVFGAEATFTSTKWEIELA